MDVLVIPAVYSSLPAAAPVQLVRKPLWYASEFDTTTRGPKSFMSPARI